MTQVITTKNDQEREDCLNRLEGMGYKLFGRTCDYGIAPNIEVDHEDRAFKTIVNHDRFSQHFPEITFAEFLSSI